MKDCSCLRPELAEKIQNWLVSFYHLDPRYKLLTFFNNVAEAGADNVIFDGAPESKKGKINLLKIFNATSILTVWRPCSNDAIRKMYEGTGVGKGLDIKGKSAKKGKLSGYVPFIQIHEEKDKPLVQEIPLKAKLRCYYSSLEARQQVIETLEPLASTLPDDYDDLTDDKDKELVSKIKKLDKYKSKSRFGIEVSQRLFWKGYIINQDIKRGPDTETGRPSMPGFQDANNKSLKIACATIPKPSPMPVVFQYDPDQPMSPQNLLMSYEENGTVQPVVSDFDGFLLGWRREALWFGCILPEDQENLMHWCVSQIEQILDGPKSSETWTQRWLDVKKRAGVHLEIPEYGFGDPKSYSLMEKVAGRMIDTGAVRHGPECFNYDFPQELDDYFLVISDTFSPVPWKYVDVNQLREILSEKIREGFVFPLNPKWILCDPGWKQLYDELMASNALYAKESRNVWFPPHSGIREKIDAICERHPNGFELKPEEPIARSRIRRGIYSPLRQSMQVGMPLSGNAKAELALLELEYDKPQYVAPPRKNARQLSGKTQMELAQLELENMSLDASVTANNTSSSNLNSHSINANLFEVKHEGFISEKYTFVKYIRKGRTGLLSKVKKRKSKMAGSAALTQNKLQRFATLSKQKLTKVKHFREKLYYALLTIDCDRIESQEVINKLKRDISNLYNLDHPNIVRLHEVYMIKSDIYIVMDFCVDDIVNRYPKTEKDVAIIIMQVLSALKYMHARGCFYHDLKLKNIAFSSRHESIVQLISFGLSLKYFSDEESYNKKEYIYNLAPEVLDGLPYTGKSDLWSLGVIMYQLFACTEPFYDSDKNKLKEKILRGEYKPMSGKAWNLVSDDAKDLIASLLVVDPENRLDADRAMQHTWVKRYEAMGMASLSGDKQKKLGEALQKYSQMTSLKKIALNVIAHNSTMEEIYSLRQLFQVYDRDHDGIISLEELKNGLKDSGYTQAEIVKIYESIDVNKTGQILYTEFIAATLLASGGIQEERIAEAFDTIDINNTGYITPENLNQSMNHDSDSRFAQESLKNMLEEADMDKDGKISFNEFRDMFGTKRSRRAEATLSVRRGGDITAN